MQLEFWENMRTEKTSERIRTVSGDQAEILTWIRRLYCPEGFDLDCTYNKGFFYRRLGFEPRFKSDLTPRVAGTIPADARALPLKHQALNSVVFDPPFLAGASKSGKIGDRYGCFFNSAQLWAMYRKSMVEICRVLKKGGWLIFKCQDFVCGRKQYLIHADIIQYAQDLRLYPVDLFILANGHGGPVAPNHGNQVHAKKTHCYFLVFRKARRKFRRLVMSEEQAEYKTPYYESEEYLELLRGRIRMFRLHLEELQKQHVRLTGKRFRV